MYYSEIVHVINVIRLAVNKSNANFLKHYNIDKLKRENNEQSQIHDYGFPSCESSEFLGFNVLWMYLYQFLSQLPAVKNLGSNCKLI